MSQAPIPLPLKALWGFGSFGTNTLLYAHSLLLLFFLSGVLGLAPALAGAMIAAAKLYDAVTDPLLGWMSDGHRGPGGRRAPFMFAAAVVLAASGPLVFAPPDLEGTALLAWVAFALFVFSVGYGMFNVPYLAMPAEITDDPHERTKLMSWRIVFVGVAGIAATAGAPILIDALGDGRAAYAVFGWILAGIALVALSACTVTALIYKSPPLPPGDRLPLLPQMKAAFSSRPFMILCLAKFLQLLGLASVSATLPFFVTQVMERPTSALAIFGLTANLVQLGSMLFWVWLAKGRSKRNLNIVAIILYAAALLSWWLAGPAEPDWAFALRSAAMGFAAGGLLLMGQSMLPDAIAHERARGGVANEASFSGFYSFIEKSASAFGSLVIGALLQAFGYVPGLKKGAEQPDSALFAITLGVAAIPAICALLSAGLIALYSLEERRPAPAALTPEQEPS